MSKLGRSLLKSLAYSVKDSKSTWKLFKNKPFFERLSLVLYTSDLLDPVFKVWYSVVAFVENVQRLIEYAPIVWKHRNWDYGFILRFQKKLYEDLYKGVYDKGHHVFSKHQARKLRTVIGLLDRLEKDQYDHWHYDYLNKKYGESEIYFEKVPNTVDGKVKGQCSIRRSTRDDRMSEDQKKRYIDERKKMWQHEEYQRKQDFEMLGKYITKYHNKWWD